MPPSNLACEPVRFVWLVDSLPLAAVPAPLSLDCHYSVASSMTDRIKLFAALHEGMTESRIQRCLCIQHRR